MLVQIISCLYLWNGFWSMWSPSVFGFHNWLFCHGRHRRRQSIELINSLIIWGVNLSKESWLDLVPHNEAKASTTPGRVLKHKADEKIPAHGLLHEGFGICFYRTWETKQQENEEPHMLSLFPFPSHLLHLILKLFAWELIYVGFAEPGQAASSHVSVFSLSSPDPRPSNHSQTSSLKRWHL